MKEQNTIKIAVFLLTVTISASMASCATKEETTAVTAKDAIACIQTMEGLDYENATSDLVERNTAYVDGNSYIRRQRDHIVTEIAQGNRNKHKQQPNITLFICNYTDANHAK